MKVFDAIRDYLRYIGEEVRNSEKDVGAFDTGELKKVPVSENLKGTYSKGKTYANRLKGKKK